MTQPEISTLVTQKFQLRVPFSFVGATLEPCVRPAAGSVCVQDTGTVPAPRAASSPHDSARGQGEPRHRRECRGESITCARWPPKARENRAATAARQLAGGHDRMRCDETEIAPLAAPGEPRLNSRPSIPKTRRPQARAPSAPIAARPRPSGARAPRPCRLDR